ncbi:LysM and putative peptidoglycan-binding domain-containing protein 2 [Morella rubra]|uniref:LysM and putative peptidoglycan-binding domain-containing protein 2 n=1 Tax=Morella rubra TaxID=262757 RepID=A0A6A1UTM3_9ROSI|nr:LysM and putative peptidoglycan-binding domain-containing protein 2 [Morella rubra]
MQMERERRNGNRNGNYNSCKVYDNGSSTDRESLPISSPPSALSASCSVGYIEHPVSKLDTLAGIAIKYGVEVADIKKMNGLVTDLQMFALKSLQIPLPGRHPPSPCLSNGSISPGYLYCARCSILNFLQYCHAIAHEPNLNLSP